MVRLSVTNLLLTALTALSFGLWMGNPYAGGFIWILLILLTEPRGE